MTPPTWLDAHGRRRPTRAWRIRCVLFWWVEVIPSRSYRRALLIALSALLCLGCTEHHLLPLESLSEGITALPNLPSVAVYRIADLRSRVQANEIGTYYESTKDSPSGFRGTPLLL